jgi:hypothetical protein
MLGTESGATITDFDGAAENAVKSYLRQKPSASFEEVFEACLKPFEGNAPINTISPRVFEAIALRTPLVMFPGSYSGIVKPNLHYIPLEKDFSNMDEVVRKIKDPVRLQEMADRAFEEIGKSKDYLFQSFVNDFDKVVSEKLREYRPSKKVWFKVASVERKITEKVLWIPIQLGRIKNRFSEIYLTFFLFLVQPYLFSAVVKEARKSDWSRQSSLWRLFRELRILSVLNKTQQKDVEWRFIYDVSCNFDIANGEVKFVSFTPGLMSPRPDTWVELNSLSANEIEKSIISKKLTKVSWDHIGFGDCLYFTLGFMSLILPIEPNRGYRMTQFMEFAKDEPKLAAQILYSTAKGERRPWISKSQFLFVGVLNKFWKALKKVKSFYLRQGSPSSSV